MSKNLTSFIAILLTSMSCIQSDNGRSSVDQSKSNQSLQTMNSYLSMFEIPATDINRAVDFYKNVLNIEIEIMEIDGMKMGVFPYENQVVNAVIMVAEGYQPSADGVTIYLNAGDDLQEPLDRIEANGGKVLMSKTAHADESGFFAIFLDSEGNRLALNSLN